MGKSHKISIHALREEGDHRRCVRWMGTDRFLSTPSARRATFSFLAGFGASVISIHALREEGDAKPEECLSDLVVISIHALREEGDKITPMSTKSLWNFYPRPPRGGRQRSLYPQRPDQNISIHALREEGDDFSEVDFFPFVNFYPRPPRGGRHSKSFTAFTFTCISIHALREEGDSWQ